MPTVLTRGAGSARGFGLFESGITTRKETFTSNGSWVCPAGVTSLIYLRAKGQDGTSDYNVNAQARYQYFRAGGGSGAFPPFADWSQVYDPMIADYNSLGVPGFQGPSAETRTTALTLFPDNTYNYSQSSPTNWNGYYFNSKSIGTDGTPQTSGTIIYNTSPTSFWLLNFQYVAFGSAGANTTAFGYTFSGGVLTGTYPNQNGFPATVTTYTSVSVTPGTTYNFVVPSGGYVEFAYYT